METARNPEVIRLKLASKRLSPQVANVLRRVLHRVLGFKRFNDIYAGVPPCEPLDISRTILDTLGVRVALDGEPLSSIPREGPIVVVGNHPHGLIDGFLFDMLVTAHRPDGRLMAINALAPLPEYQGRLILVGKRGRRSRQKLSSRGWRECFKWLADGHVLGVFPAGSVAHFEWRTLSVRDQQWSPHVATLVRRTGAAVLPVHIHGRNSLRFQVAGVLIPPLQEVLLFGELAKMRNQTVRVTIGRVIPPGELSGFASDEDRIAFLRTATETLAQG